VAHHPQAPCRCYLACTALALESWGQIKEFDGHTVDTANPIFYLFFFFLGHFLISMSQTSVEQAFFLNQVQIAFVQVSVSQVPRAVTDNLGQDAITDAAIGHLASAFEAEGPEAIDVFFQMCAPTSNTHTSTSSVFSFDAVRNKALSGTRHCPCCTILVPICTLLSRGPRSRLCSLLLTTTQLKWDCCMLDIFAQQSSKSKEGVHLMTSWTRLNKALVGILLKMIFYTSCHPPFSIRYSRCLTDSQAIGTKLTLIISPLSSPRFMKPKQIQP
jgi:hypothetical protein